MSQVFSGPFLGHYGRQAGAVITFEWVPDPKVWSDKILEIADNLDDRTVPLILSQEIIRKDIESNFAGEHDPEGQPWEPWATAYHTDSEGNRGDRQYDIDPVSGKQTKTPHRYGDRYKQFHSGRILDWTGELKEAATSDHAFVQISGETVNNDSLYYDTSGLPPYGMWHQTGIENRPGSGPLPQRRFLGISDQAQEEILITFGEWFDAEIEMAVSSKGKIFTRPRRSSTRQTL